MREWNAWVREYRAAQHEERMRAFDKFVPGTPENVAYMAALRKDLLASTTEGKSPWEDDEDVTQPRKE